MGEEGEGCIQTLRREFIKTSMTGAWRRAEVTFHASTIVEMMHVILKPSPGLGRLWVVGLASQMDHVSWVTWIVFKYHLLEIGLTQNQKTMALRTVTTVDFFYLIMCEVPA